MGSNRTRTLTIVAVGVGVVLVLIGYAVLVRGYSVQISRTDAAEAETVAIAEPARDLATDVLAACRSNDAADLKALGISCTKAQDTRQTIDDASSTAEVRYVPVPGRDGRDAPTLAQVFATLQPVMQQRIDSVLAATFARCVASGECKGPKGDKGDSITGPKGEPGRGIVSASCSESTGRWQIDYSDGSTDSDAGPCYVAPTPDPEPTLLP